MHQVGVYVTAKLEHASKLGKMPDGFHNVARWIWMASEAQANLKPVSHWQRENFIDIEAAEAVICYIEPQDNLKGSLIEIGYAIAHGKKVWIAGNAIPDGSGGWHGLVMAGGMDVPHKDIMPWALYTPAIRIVPNLEAAFRGIKQHFRPDDKISHKDQ